MDARTRKLLQDAANALDGALSDLEAWASAGPEGMTPDEKRRLAEYERTRDRVRKYASK